MTFSAGDAGAQIASAMSADRNESGGLYGVRNDQYSRIDECELNDFSGRGKRVAETWENRNDEFYKEKNSTLYTPSVAISCHIRDERCP